MANDRDPSRHTLLFILVPMLLTFAIQRIVLHHSHPDTHVYIAGVVVHHLFWGLLILIPTAFLLAFGIRSPLRRKLALAVLGFSSAMVLDEVIYLNFTDASGVAYRSAISLQGGFAFVGLAAAFLIVYGLLRGPEDRTPPGL